MASIADLQGVLNHVNRHFVWEADSFVWSAPEHWESNADILAKTDAHGVVHGDCDCHAEMCRAELRRLGIANRIVICIVETGECHAVIEVEGFILDCRQPYVTSRELLPYNFLSVSGFEPGDPWHQIVD